MSNFVCVPVVNFKLLLKNLFLDFWNLKLLMSNITVTSIFISDEDIYAVVLLQNWVRVNQCICFLLNIGRFPHSACWLQPLKPGGDRKSADVRRKTYTLIYPDPQTLQNPNKQKRSSLTRVKTCLIVVCGRSLPEWIPSRPGEQVRRLNRVTRRNGQLLERQPRANVI